VVAFALIGEVLKPKRFAGIFSAAPSVALAGLTITVLLKGPRPAAEDTLGMILGALGFVAYCAAAVPMVKRLGALAGSATCMVVWIGVAFGLYELLLR